MLRRRAALQTVAAKLVSGGPGITTTFITGMLKGLVQDTAERRPGSAVLRIGALTALTTGALAHTALIHGFAPAAPWSRPSA